MSRLRCTHRFGFPTHSSSLVKYERMVHRRGMIKTKKEEKEEERSSLTTIVEKQVEPDGRTSAGKGEKRWRCNEVESNQSGSGIFYYAGLSRLWHSCFVEPSVDGDRVLRDRGLDYDRPSRFPYISRASNGPLILRRLEKPEIKKRNMRRYMYRGASWREREREREKRPATVRNR